MHLHVARLSSPRAFIVLSPPTAVVIRLYSGWNYVSLRLGAEVVEYEESGEDARTAYNLMWPQAPASFCRVGVDPLTQGPSTR